MFGKEGGMMPDNHEPLHPLDRFAVERLLDDKIKQLRDELRSDLEFSPELLEISQRLDVLTRLTLAHRVSIVSFIAEMVMQLNSVYTHNAKSRILRYISNARASFLRGMESDDNPWSEYKHWRSNLRNSLLPIMGEVRLNDLIPQNDVFLALASVDDESHEKEGS